MSEFSILQGDVLDMLGTMPDESVHVAVTSPPYWGLRDYGVAPRAWGGDPGCAHTWGAMDRQGKAALSGGCFCRECGAWRGVFGLEPSHSLYVEHAVLIFREIQRVLRPEGTLWLNLGDSYANDRKWGGKSGAKNYTSDAGGYPRHKMATGLKPKDLVGIPWRVAFALQDDGWYLRSDIIWEKPNPMPESVSDRPTKAHEYLFLLAKSERYFYDREAVLEPLTTAAKENYPARAKILGRGKQEASGAFPGSPQRDSSGGFPPSYRGSSFQTGKTAASWGNIGQGPRYEHAGRNRRSVWTIATEPFPGAHFATFPPALVEPCVLAGTSGRGCCPECGHPWDRVVIRKPMRIERSERSQALGVFGRTAASGTMVEAASSITSGWRPSCRCYDARYREDLPEPRRARKRTQRAAWPDRWLRVRLRPGKDGWPTTPCTVLDPFAGSGTTGLVAARHNRRFVGIELNPEYCAMARKRITSEAPLLNVEVPA